ncbi:MAG: tetratricopeptide repeat protein, partial [Cenarchaeum sp. SB0663_bin_5]|nr:tetratricopeptide repeat protein [Cenarchaeum sp. SB0663_bin_5]
SLNKKNPALHLHSGIILGKMKKNKEALKVLENIERKFGAHPDVTFQQGIQLAEMGEHKKAIKIFENMGESHADNVNIIYAISRSRAAIGEYDDALRLLKKAVSKSPKVIRAWAKDEDIFNPLHANKAFRRLVKM